MGALGYKSFVMSGAERGTRTPKGLLPLAPQASASASSATSALAGSASALMGRAFGPSLIPHVLA